MNYILEERLDRLQDKGVIMIDPRQVYIAPEVREDRIFAGAILHPGTRLTGARTLICSGAKIGTEGPAVIHETVLGPEAEVASGYLAKSTLLASAKAGANSHYREGTLLEEQASTAHCVGLKQSILMYGVTMGSLINFCDALLSGGSSRKKHTEVGSGFIHFNYTPWGEFGDKATPSLIGNVTEGVFLDTPRIFLGGMSGMAGPGFVDFGAMTPAGQVIRHPVAENTMHSEHIPLIDQTWSPTETRFSEAHFDRIRMRNIEYLVQLRALKEWYRQIRLRRAELAQDEQNILVYQGAQETIDACIRERISRYKKFTAEWDRTPLHAELLDEEFSQAPDVIRDGGKAVYDSWIHTMTAEDKDALHRWLKDETDRLREVL